MTRVSSFGQSQLLLNSIMQNQSQLATTQDQISSGEVSQTFSGLAGQAETLLGAQSVQSQNTTYLSTLQQVAQQLNMNDLQVNAVQTNATNLKQTLVQAIGNNQASGLTDLLQQTLSNTAGSLNTKIGSNYIFAGSKVNTPPVSSSSLSDLMSAPSAASLFQNDTTKPAAQTSANGTTQYGILASDVGQNLLQVVQNIANYSAGPNGPLDGTLTPTQVTFLQGQIASLNTAIDGIQNQVSSNGLTQQTVDNMTTQTQTSSNYLQSFISDIKDTNMAQAATNLSNDQTALQASYAVEAKLSNLSLLSYLPVG